MNNDVLNLDPGKFGETILDEAHRLLHFSLNMSANGLALKDATFILSAKGYEELRQSADYGSQWINMQDKKTLMGVPFRVTIDDDTTTPRIELMMAPMLHARRTAKK